MDFEVIVNCTLLEIDTESALESAGNKHVLSLLNDYEDGQWRYKKFQDFIWNNIADTALSQRERESLQEKPSSILSSAAQNLRLTDAENDISKGSELAEIVLYGIMKNQYKAIPIVPKIFYKQNTQDNAKGADSVHIVIEEDDDFSLWFGEAKFYNSIENARLNEIVTSVKNSLSTDKLKKENAIILNVKDIDDIDISDDSKEKIKEALANKNSIDPLKPKINIPILLLHKCPITQKTQQITDDYYKEIKEFHKDRATAYFTKQVEKLKDDIFKYSDIKFHLILFPVPEKEPIIEKFVSKVKFFKS